MTEPTTQPTSSASPSSSPKSNQAMGLVVVGLIAVLVIGGLLWKMTDNSAKTVSSEVSTEKLTVSPTPDMVIASPVANAASYKDGTYQVVGNYQSPGGPESIDVKVTLEGNVIKDAEVVSNAELPNSKKFQGLFISGYKEQVIGKNINDVMLTKVSGSSLTPKGFNDAIEKIKAEAAQT